MRERRMKSRFQQYLWVFLVIFLSIVFGGALALLATPL